MLAKELELMGLPTVQIAAVTCIALMAGSNRIIPAPAIVHPVGNASLDQKAEKALRRTIVEKAFEALETELAEQKLFALI